MKVIITGTTGMVGEGVLIECLNDTRIESILSISRQPFGRSHPKLKELLVDDFMNIGNYAAQLAGYDACLFCAGVSSVGMSEEKYTRITYTLTMLFAETLKATNPQMTFIYVSGAHTNANGKQMWARVKGRTENALANLGFKAQYNFRPGAMKPFKEQIHFKGFNKYAGLLYPVLSIFFPGMTLSQLGRAMINTVQKGYTKNVLEVKDIKAQAKA
jgi:nucleoside-diphosphate-sugar epimerase